MLWRREGEVGAPAVAEYDVEFQALIVDDSSGLYYRTKVPLFVDLQKIESEEADFVVPPRPSVVVAAAAAVGVVVDISLVAVVVLVMGRT